jgi:glycosyltransferase involved in cell wall biosynthesis
MMSAIRIGFVMEGALGHVTHAQSVREWVGRDSAVDAHWMTVPHKAQDIWDRLPGLSFSTRMSLRARAVMRPVLRHQQLDCLYLHTQSLSLFSIGLMARIPTVVSLDAAPSDFVSMADAYGWKPRGGPANRIKSEWFRKVFLRAAGLVGISHWVKESLVRDYGVAPEKIRVFPFGVDMRQWEIPARQPTAGRRLRLLFVGGDFARKGGPELLSAFQHGLAHFCELDIVTGEHPIACGEFVRTHSGLTPNSPVLQRLFAAADLFVMPTQGDATPIAVIEAMASGLPVITTRIGALREIVEDGVSGCVVPAACPQAIVEAVTSLAADPAKMVAMGRAARAAVERSFNAETNCKGLIAYLKEVSGRSLGRSEPR